MCTRKKSFIASLGVRQQQAQLLGTSHFLTTLAAIVTHTDLKEFLIKRVTLFRTAETHLTMDTIEFSFNPKWILETIYFPYAQAVW